MLAVKVEHGGFHRRLDMDRGSEIEGLQAAPAGIARAEAAADFRHHARVRPEPRLHHQRAAFLQRLPDRFATRHFAEAGAPVFIGQHQHVAGEERRVRPAEVEQHCIVPGYGHHAHADDPGRLAHAATASFALARRISTSSSASSSGFSPVSGGRTAPAGLPTRSQPALTMETA